MGHSGYSYDDHAARVSHRAVTGTPTFKHDDDVKKGRAATKVHPSLNPFGVTRESRDSDAHPVTIPIVTGIDTTGSTQAVHEIIERNLSKLMGTFLADKASGKAYLGDAYPAIMIAAFDDYQAQVGYRGMGGPDSGVLQVGQFESGIEIDDNITNVWLTANGGGTYDESYELLFYFLARHTAHDHLEKRGRKGYAFFIGDEHPYRAVSKEQVKAVIGDDLQSDISLKDIVEEMKQKYHCFFILPNMTNHWHDDGLVKFWGELLGQQNALRLDDPEKVCELIAATVALCEENVGIDELESDGVIDPAMKSALVPLAAAGGRSLATVSAEGLPIPTGDAGEVERL